MEEAYLTELSAVPTTNELVKEMARLIRLQSVKVEILLALQPCAKLAVLSVVVVRTNALVYSGVWKRHMRKKPAKERRRKEMVSKQEDSVCDDRVRTGWKVGIAVLSHDCALSVCSGLDGRWTQRARALAREGEEEKRDRRGEIERGMHRERQRY